MIAHREWTERDEKLEIDAEWEKPLSGASGNASTFQQVESLMHATHVPCPWPGKHFFLI